MKGILADVNIQGHADLLVAIMRADPWKLFWDHLQLGYFHFTDVGLAANAPDAEVWTFCQHQELVLVTDNRNRKDADSLEATIRTQNTPTSLPVFTIGSTPTLAKNRDYVNRVIGSLLDALLRIDSLRGTGRLYLP